MRPSEDFDGLPGEDPDWGNADQPEQLGPQGAALILELQRLRHAFDQEAQSSPRRPARRAEARPVRGKPQRSPKRRRKGRMSKAIEICLQQFGLKSADAAERKPIPATEEAEPLPPRRRSPALAPRDPLTMDLTAPGPEISTGAGGLHQPMQFEAPELALPRASNKQLTTGLVVQRCRAGAMAAITYLIKDPGTPSEDSNNLTVRALGAFDRELRSGLRVLILACIVGGGCFFLMPLAGAVVVPGNLVVESHVKTIQHPSGGVVAEIKVFE